MKIIELQAELDQFDPNLPLTFTLGDFAVGSGYHVTELRLSHSTGVDCGGNKETWKEARLQVLDGTGGDRMRLEKFSGILKTCVEALPELETAELKIEFSPGNAGLRVLDFSAPALVNGRVEISLKDIAAVCKPAQRAHSNRSRVSCCAAGNSGVGIGSSCCQ